jgi:hypothetical protein
MINIYKTMFRKREGKRSLARPMHEGKDNIKIDLKDIKLCGVNRIHVARGTDQWWALVNTVTKLHVP